MRLIDRNNYSVQEYPFVGYDDMQQVANDVEGKYINYFSYCGYFTVHSCLEEARIWHDINQDDGPMQLVFDDDQKWHYGELNTNSITSCSCKKCRLE